MPHDQRIRHIVELLKYIADKDRHHKGENEFERTAFRQIFGHRKMPR